MAGLGPCGRQLLCGHRLSHLLLCGFLTVFWLFSLKLECDKLASEKSEMQRHYVMVRTDAGVRVGAPVLPPCRGAAGLLARLKLAFLKAGLFHVIPAGRVTVCLPGDEDEPFSRGIPGKAVLCASYQGAQRRW